MYGYNGRTAKVTETLTARDIQKTLDGASITIHRAIEMHELELRRVSNEEGMVSTSRAFLKSAEPL